MTRLRIEVERVLFPCIVAITGVGLVLQLLGCFLPYWFIVDIDNHYSTIGLYHTTTCNFGRCTGQWYGHMVDTWLNGDLYFSRWIQTFSLVFGLVGFITSLIQLMNRRRGQLRKNFSHSVFFMFTLPAGFLAVVGVMVFSKMEKDQTWGETGACCILTLLAGILWLLSALLSCVWCREQINDYDERLAARYLYPSTHL